MKRIEKFKKWTESFISELFVNFISLIYMFLEIPKEKRERSQKYVEK